MKRLNKKGFTLVELLAVIVVLALLMVVAASSIGTALDNSKQKSLLTEAQKLSTNISAEAQSLLLTGNLSDTNLKKVYSGKDGSDYAYNVTLTKNGYIKSLVVCYKDEYSVTATVSNNIVTIPDKVDATKSTTCVSGYTGSVTVES